jgi:FtsZ-binding cell division protein ZapB
MLKSFYMLVIVSSCIFVSCRATKTKSDKKEPVVQRLGEPYYRWGVQQQSQPPFYRFMWSAESDLEQAQIVALLETEGKKLKGRIAKLEVRTDLLESKIEKLERENEQLRTESKEQREWSDFWKRLTKILMKERVTQWRK